MKTLLKQTLFTVLCLITALPSAAYDFEYEGGYYNILTDSTCEITYKVKDEETENYKGDFNIPVNVRDGSGYI